MTKPVHPEIGRTLKVSDLKPRGQQIVWLHKDGRPVASVWVGSVNAHFVEFIAGEIGTHFLAQRCGQDLDEITDDSNIPMAIYEYLGNP